MAEITRPYTFVDGRTEAGKITAARLNDNFDEVYDLVNGELDEDNIDPTSEIVLTSKANTFTEKQTFAGTDHAKQEAENFVVEQVAVLPSWVSGDQGRLIQVAGGNTYIGGTADWILLEGSVPATLRQYAFTGIVDENDDLLIPFKTAGSSPTLLLSLKGAIFPKRFYTELGLHTHTVTDTGHTHNTAIGSHSHGTTQYALSTHTHSVSGDTGNQSANHTHTVTGSSGSEEAGTGSYSHEHDISLTSGNQSASHTHAVSLTSGTPSAAGAIASADLGTITSTSVTTGIALGNAGVNGGTLASAVKDYGDSLKVYIDATEITAGLLAALGWAKIGDGTVSHAFHASGTGEIDISSLVTLSAGIHTLKITEPTAGKGCRVQVHLETL